MNIRLARRSKPLPSQSGSLSKCTKNSNIYCTKIHFISIHFSLGNHTHSVLKVILSVIRLAGRFSDVYKINCSAHVHHFLTVFWTTMKFYCMLQRNNLYQASVEQTILVRISSLWVWSYCTFPYNTRYQNLQHALNAL